MRNSRVSLVAIGLVLLLPTCALAQLGGPGQWDGQHFLDVPPEFPPVDLPEEPGPGGILEEPGADSVVFVVDRSCSMGWGSSSLEVPGIPGATPWQAAAYELTRAINNLDGEARFGAILFDSGHVIWRTTLEVATEANKGSAAGWVAGYGPGGGTHYTTPVARAINIGGGPPEVIMFLSDGEPNEGYSAVGAIASANAGRCIINTICFGGAGGAARQIMQDIASQNGGQCRIIP